MATREIVVNMVPGGVTPVIHVSQYDDGYGITANLIENSGTYTVPTGATVSIEGTKPDGHGYAYLCTYQDNAVVIPVNTQMTAVKGKHPCELVVRKDGLRVGSKNMIMAVEVAGLGEDTIISDTELPAIIALAQEQEEAAASSASQAAASAIQAASSAARAETAKTAAMDAAEDAIDAAQELQTAIQFNAALIHETASGAVASFADGADNIPMQSVVAEITPVQSGSGDPSPENIRPISGRTGMTVTRAGKNLLKMPTYAEIQAAPTVVNYKSVTLHLAPNTTYYLSTKFLNGYTANGKGMYALLTNSAINNDNWKAIAHASNADGKVDGTMATGADGLLWLRFYGQTEEKLNELYANSEIQLEVGTSATAYEPYVGQTYPITWESIAGTVYGGTLDVVSGVLTVTDALIASYDGETLPSTWISDRDVYAEGTTPTTGAQVVYKLATPQTYQLTPTEVRTILGGNTIYTDAGDVSVEYVADTKLYIDNKVAELQALILEN